ncbi:hypothetical protein EUGRSUZ_D01455 [Eucalyptus grandis]|uniref:Uncharacterized protein n=2 Tax=Eucalyptus grandis TaxID=71139 RepID=A0ACC3L4V8_EUCGR|nr:hypothetical protein EUGRSUZ_D01455 [Eucalyptus grandis]
MVFKSDDDAFEYYSNFVRKSGFSHDFVCYWSGFAPVRKKPSGEHHRDRKSVRCSCDAKMYLSKEVVEGVSKWCVVQFSNVHNHELLEDNQVRLLPAYRKIHAADQERILLLSKAGFPIHRIVKVLELEKGIQGGQLPFLERDVRNFIQNRKKVVQENDALLNEKRENDIMELLEACKASKQADEGFSYVYSVDDNDKLEHITWSYSNSINAYATFGDVDEAPQSFSWALEMFVWFMRGRSPQTILTDLDPGLRDAVRGKLANTKHITCTWNISPKLSSWFSVPLGSQYADFRSEFDAFHYVENTEDFELRWNEMVSRFGLGSDKRIALLYSIRNSWVGISATFQNQSHHEMQYMPSKACIPMEEHAQSILTPFGFKALQNELVLAMQYAMSELADGSYLLRHYKKMNDDCLVMWIPEEEQIHCSCKEFESSGILCRHGLSVFIRKNYFQLPSKYFITRWRRESTITCYDEPAPQDSDNEWFREYQSLSASLFIESSLTRGCTNYVRRELMKEVKRILEEVRNMPKTDGVTVDMTLSPTG